MAKEDHETKWFPQVREPLRILVGGEDNSWSNARRVGEGGSFNSNVVATSRVDNYHQVRYSSR